MLKIQKSIVILQKFKRNFASEVRTRNFFELDPIYPDLNDEYVKLNQDADKLPFYQNINQMDKIFKQQTKGLVKNVKNTIKLQNEKRTQNLKQMQKSEKDKKGSSYLSRIAEKILLDEELNLPYGFGFDDFIKRVKDNQLQSEDQKYMDILKSITLRLNMVDEQDLIQLHRETIAIENKDNFKQQARNHILQKIIQEIQLIKNEQKDQKKLFKQLASEFLEESKLTQQFLDQAFENFQNDQQQIEKFLKEEKVDQFAQVLSREDVDLKIQQIKDAKSQSISEKNLLKRENKPSNSEILNSDKVFLNIPKLKSLRSVDANEQKIQTVLQKIKDNYFDNKIAFINEYYEEKEDPFAYLKQTDSEKQINQLLKSINQQKLRETSSFKDIFENIDYLIESAPLSLKRKIQNNQQNQKFNPTFCNQEFSPSDLLWTELAQNFQDVVPNFNSKQKETKQESQDEIQQSCEYVKNSLPEKEYILQYDVRRDEKQLSQQIDLNEDDLPENQKFEMELYRSIKQSPFFHHHLQQNIKYFAERMQEGNFAYQVGQMNGSRVNDIENYDRTYEIGNSQQNVVVSKNQTYKQYQPNEKIFASGKRKKCTALCILYQGSGRVQYIVSVILTKISHKFQFFYN